MKDYFREFLIPNRPGFGSASAPSAPKSVATNSEKTKAPMKSRIMLAAGLVGVGLISWKASKWHTIITSSSDK